VTRCRFAVCPWPENETLPFLLNAGYSPRGHIYGLTFRQASCVKSVLLNYPRISPRKPNPSESLLELFLTRPWRILFRDGSVHLETAAITIEMSIRRRIATWREGYYGNAAIDIQRPSGNREVAGQFLSIETLPTGKGVIQ
jgi:hypothetical protein